MIAGSARGKKVNVSSEGEKLPVQLTQKVKECGDRAAIVPRSERCLPRDTKERIVTKHRIITRDRDRSIDRATFRNLNASDS